jgi:hypothetical protein
LSELDSYRDKIFEQIFLNDRVGKGLLIHNLAPAATVGIEIINHVLILFLGLGNSLVETIPGLSRCRPGTISLNPASIKQPGKSDFSFAFILSPNK